MSFTYAWANEEHTHILRSDGARITAAEGSANYHDVTAWVAAGNTITPFAVDLASEKATYRRRVDDAAEAERQRYITPGAGMAMTYQEKFAQAGAVHAMGQAAANALSQAEREQQFPTLSASVGLEAATLWDCAQLVLEKYAQFCALSMVIERARLSGKAAIAAATDVAGVRAAYGAIAWPTP